MQWLRIILYCAILIAFLLVPERTVTVEETYIPENEVVEIQVEAEIPQSASMVFVGDIMLGRHVEKLMAEHGGEYPFKNIPLMFEGVDVLVGNYEGVIPTTHVPTPGGGMRFSMREETLSHLSGVGFDVLSFANNHSYDYGNAAFLNTQVLCKKYDIVCGGNAGKLTHESLKFVEVGEYVVGMVFIHTLFAEPDTQRLNEYMEILRMYSDVQIAYIHWGNEYELIHSNAQETLAHTLVDMGVDAVVGHHPHVVQDVELYKNVPIFYSLGNFIFDQYFSTDVQEGIVVRLDIDDSLLTFDIDGVSSIENRSQPAPMEEVRTVELLQRIFAAYHEDERVSVEKGIISIKQE